MSEDTIQRAVFAHIARRGRADVVFFAVPNGGARNRIEAARMKAAGVVAGAPDIVLVANGRVFALELKTAAGRLSQAQVDMHVRLRLAGAQVAVAHGLDAALGQLQACGLIHPAGRTA